MLNEHEIKTWFAAEVKDRMEDLGLRPYHLPPLCHFKHEYLSGYLHGTSLPNLWSIVLMAEHLDCSVDDLLGFEEYDDIVYEPYLASQMFSDKEGFAMCVSDRLKRFMRNRGTNIDEVSKKTGVSISTIKKWTASRPTLPRTWDFLSFCDALGCSPSELLGY